jgi:hypothetical protein
MLRRLCLLNTASTLLVLLAACAPDSRGEPGDADAGANAPVDASSGPDAVPFADAGHLADAGPVVDYTVYVHTKDKLYTMDPTTFAVTLVGPFSAPGADQITDLAVAADGTIYVISKTKLYVADAVDGHVTLRASLSTSPTAGNVGLTFLPNGDLLATDKSGGIRSINTTTGAVTEIGTFSNGFTTAGDLVAVADGTMYAISDHGEGGSNAFDNNWLIKVDPATGAATKVGQIGAKGVFGAAFVNGKVIVFTSTGQVVEVDPTTGVGTPRASSTIEWWGAGVSPLVPGVG